MSRINDQASYLDMWCLMLRNGYNSTSELKFEVEISDDFPNCLDCLSDINIIRQHIYSLLRKLQAQRDLIKIDDVYNFDYYGSIRKV